MADSSPFIECSWSPVYVVISDDEDDDIQLTTGHDRSTVDHQIPCDLQAIENQQATGHRDYFGDPGSTEHHQTVTNQTSSAGPSNPQPSYTSPTDVKPTVTPCPDLPQPTGRGPSLPQPTGPGPSLRQPTGACPRAIARDQQQLWSMFQGWCSMRGVQPQVSKPELSQLGTPRNHDNGPPVIPTLPLTPPAQDGDQMSQDQTPSTSAGTAATMDRQSHLPHVRNSATNPNHPVPVNQGEADHKHPVSVVNLGDVDHSNPVPVVNQEETDDKHRVHDSTVTVSVGDELVSCRPQTTVGEQLVPDIPARCEDHTHSPILVSTKTSIENNEGGNAHPGLDTCSSSPACPNMTSPQRHDVSRYTCTQCRKVFQTAEWLERHRALCEKLYLCIGCVTFFSKKEHLSAHACGAGEQPLGVAVSAQARTTLLASCAVCRVCGRCVYSPETRRIHAGFHQPYAQGAAVKPACCRPCHSYFPTVQLASQHVSMCHAGQYSDVITVVNSRDVSEDSVPPPDELFTTYHSVVAAAEGGDDRESVDDRGTAENRNNLYQDTHGGTLVMNFFCARCNFRYLTREDMVEHTCTTQNTQIGQVVEQAEQQNTCVTCGRYFLFPLLLLHHQEEHEAADRGRGGALKPHRCEGCVTYYVTESGLQDHMTNCHRPDLPLERVVVTRDTYEDEDVIVIDDDRTGPPGGEGNRLEANTTHSSAAYTTDTTFRFSCGPREAGGRVTEQHLLPGDRLIAPSGFVTGSAGVEAVTDDEDAIVVDGSDSGSCISSRGSGNIQVNNGYRVYLEQCGICKMRIHGRHNMRSHMRVHDSIDGKTGERKRYQCRKCKCYFLTLKYFRSHNCSQRELGLTGRFRCSICRRKYAKAGNLRMHIGTHDPIDARTGKRKRHRCSLCHVYFPSYKGMSNHRAICRTHMATVSMTAPHTQPSTSHRVNVANSSYQRPKRKRCPVCNKVFRLPHNLPQHMRIHNPTDLRTGLRKPHQCVPCNAYFPSPGALSYHRSRCKHNSKTYTVGVYSDSTTTVCSPTDDVTSDDPASYVNRHVSDGLSHMGTATGDICSRTDSETENETVNSVEVRNSNGKAANDTTVVSDASCCPVCARPFTRQSNRNKHMMLHNPINPWTGQRKPYRCAPCSIYFYDQTDLRKHQLRFCKHSNSNNSGVNDSSISIRIKCAVCHLSFRLPQHLRRHQRIHEPIDAKTGETKNFRCYDCDGYFVTQATLVWHRSMRHKARPSSSRNRPTGAEDCEVLKYHCKSCATYHVAESLLRDHMTNCHPLEGTAVRNWVTQDTSDTKDVLLVRSGETERSTSSVDKPQENTQTHNTDSSTGPTDSTPSVYCCVPCNVHVQLCGLLVFHLTTIHAMERDTAERIVRETDGRVTQQHLLPGDTGGGQSDLQSALKTSSTPSTNARNCQESLVLQNHHNR